MNLKWTRALATCFALFGLSACQHDNASSSNPEIHVEAPLDVSKAGNQVSLDFESTPESTDPKKIYMVNLTFDRTGATDPLSAIDGTPPRALLPFKVNVARLVDGKEEPLPLIDGSQYLGEIDPSRYPNFVPEDHQTGVYYSFVYAGSMSGHEGYMCLGRFALVKHGKYRAKIETIQDQAIFSGVKSIVSVEKRFNLGE